MTASIPPVASAPAVPLPVRLADMEALEARYLATAPEARVGLHAELPFYALLTDGERFALERRFPLELAGAPDASAAGATEGTRVAWDLRARELVVCMLQFGERALKARMDLVRTVAPGDDVAVLAMTATGSFLELGRPQPMPAPGSGGLRRFVYRASARPGGHREDGAVRLTEPVTLGNPVEVGTLRTTELLIVAAGPTLPSDDDLVPGSLLFGPVDDAPVQTPDPVRVSAARFRVLVDAACNASPTLAPALVARTIAHAVAIQRELAPNGGRDLRETLSFTADGGAHYEVVPGFGNFDLVRHTPSRGAAEWFYDVELGDQLLVDGAPLVLTHTSRTAGKQLLYIFRVARVDGR